jgi:RNA polymerase sigma factor (TIGR02999 family)
MHHATDVTQMLIQWGEGDEEALSDLLPLLYDRLREMAHARLRAERAAHTLGTTALVHEAYLRLVDIDRVDWQDRAHFLAVASTTMRRILVDYARRRCAAKRGGAAENAPLNEERVASDQFIPGDKVGLVLDLDDALERLAETHERPSKTLELYYFGGLTLEETGAALGTSAATAMRDLRFAKAWLARAWGEAPELE